MSDFNVGSISVSADEILHYVELHDMIDADAICSLIQMSKKQKILEEHKYDIWQGKNGKWYTYLPKEDGSRIQRVRLTREELEKCIVEHYQDNISINRAYTEWLAEKQMYGEIQSQSVNKYKNSYRRFFTENSDAQPIMQKKIKNITEDDLEQFIRTSIVHLSLTQKAYSELRILINGIFKYAKKKKYTELSITNFFGDLQISKRSFKKVMKDPKSEVYQEEEVAKITGYLRRQTTDIRALGILLMFETGLRIGELSALKKEDITNRSIHVSRTEVKDKDADDKWTCYVKDYPKTDAGDRYILLTDNALETVQLIEACSGDDEYLFEERGKRIRSHAFRRKLMRICEKLCVEYKSNHKIRKTYGTMLLDNHVDDSIVAEQMGHTDVATTRKYYYFCNKAENKKREQICLAIGNV